MKDLTRILEEFLGETALFPGDDILMEVFLNPASGILSSEKKRQPLIDLMEERRGYGSADESDRSVRVRIHIPQNRDRVFPELEEGAKRLLAAHNENRGGRNLRTLLVTAGGDGFHRDCAAHLMGMALPRPERLILFRFPLGTGNDTPLITRPMEALELFTKPLDAVPELLIRVDTARGRRDYALNVVSFGLDAFVCLLTEKWKGRLRGDIYKIMVDVSALFYDFYHRTRTSRITLYPLATGDSMETGAPVVLEKRALLNVFGRRGHTDYGGGKKILPGEENHLITDMFRLPGRIMLKGLFMKGGHWPGGKRVHFFQTGKMVLDYPAPLLMELDGELTRLGREDFPVTLTRCSLPFPVLN